MKHQKIKHWLLKTPPTKLTTVTNVTSFKKAKTTIGIDENIDPEQKPLYKTNVYVHQFISLLINIHGLAGNQMYVYTLIRSFISWSIKLCDIQV